MPLYDKRFTAAEIQQLAARLKNRYSRQSTWDAVQAAFVTMTNELSVKGSAEVLANPIKGVRTGLGGYVVRENAALVRGYPIIRLNIPDNDEKMRDWAGSTGEPWLTAGTRQAQRGGRTWSRQPTDLFTFGRSVSFVSAMPSEYATKEYTGLVDAYNKAAEAGDDEEYRRLKGDIKRYKQSCFPILWRYVSPRHTWPVRDAAHPLPVVVEVRKMYRDDIKSEFGDDKIPSTHSRASADNTLDVIHWANWQYCGTIICGTDAENAVMAKEYEHGMGMNPYTLIEGELLPENDHGIEWAGSLFHATDMLETLDEILSDLRHNHREWTTAPIVQSFDPERYEDSAISGGPPKAISVKAASEPLSKWITESWDLAPVPQLNPQSMILLQKLEERVTAQLIFDIRSGNVKSGTSNVLGTSLVQISERMLNPYVDGLNEGFVNVCKLLIRSLGSLNREYPDSPDDVYVFPNYKGTATGGAIGTSPKDWVGWENAIQCRLDRAIPVEESQAIGNAERMIGMGLAPEQVMEEYLGRENATADLERGWRSKLKAATQDQAIEKILALSGNAIQQLSPEEASEFQGLLAADPELRDIVAGLPETIPGNVRQANSNVNRTGVPINGREQNQPLTISREGG